MIEILILEIISLVSFIFSLFLIFIDFTTIDGLAVIFVWVVMVSIIISMSIGKTKISNIAILLLLVPLVFYRDFKYMILLITTTIIVFLYIKTSLQKGRYLAYVAMFRNSVILYAVLFYLKIIYTQFSWFLGKESIFLIVFLLSSIVLIRSIRHLETNMDSVRIKNSNRKYIVGIIAVFIIGTMDSFKNIFVDFATKLFEVIEYGVYIVTYPINKFFYWFFSIFENMEGAPEEIIIGEGEIPSDIVEPEVVEGFSERYPKEPAEQIRYYYRKLLDKLKKEDIEIRKQDTSLDVNNKAIDRFGDEIKDMRKLYIDSRYGDGKVDKETVEKMKTLYKNI